MRQHVKGRQVFWILMGIDIFPKFQLEVERLCATLKGICDHHIKLIGVFTRQPHLR